MATYDRDIGNITHFCARYEGLSMIDGFNDEGSIHLRLQKFLLPIILVTSLTAVLHIVLKRFGQVIFVPQMIAAIILGPFVMEHNEKLSEWLFPPKTVLVLNLCELFGLVNIMFTVGARMDISMIRRSGRLAVIIGVGSYIIPMIVTTIVVYTVRDDLQLDESLRLTLSMVASLECTVSFPVILTVLTDLNILNSELGRLTLSSSLIASLLALTFTTFIGHVTISKPFRKAVLLKNLSLIFMIIFIIYALRPAIIWMMRRTLEGKSFKHTYVLNIIFMVFGCSLFGEFTGFHGLLGPLILGLVAPVDPPMGSPLTNKIEYFASVVFMPCFIINIGRNVDLLSVKPYQVFAVELMVLVTTVTKVLTIILPSLYYKIPLKDAISLTLLLNTRGIYDVYIFRVYHRRKLVTDESFAIMVLTSMLKSTLFIPLVRYIYDSSRRYEAYRIRTLQHNQDEDKLHILACIHEPDDVDIIVNILQVSTHPGRPVGVYVMNLEEYVGSYIPVVIPHRLDQVRSNNNTMVDRMINSFSQFKEANEGHVFVQCFTAVAPYVTMHDDICLMAFENSTSLMIIPFQKTNHYLRKTVVKNILQCAPCSIGILYDRGTFMKAKPIFSRIPTIHVCVVFVGGPDDRESLAYGARMAEDHKIFLQVISFTDMCHTSIDLMEKQRDIDMINGFTTNTDGNRNIKYLEEKVTEGSQTLQKLNLIGNDFDLILVGKRHDSESQVLKGLQEWNEEEELGVVGDFLASSDFQSMASIMVIQQQPSVVKGMIGKTNTFK